jgi:hypothetical protein
VYSPSIIEQRLAAHRKLGEHFSRRPADECIDIAAKLQQLRKDKRGKDLPKGQLARPLDKAEQEHIASEMTICRNDFGYWFERYCNVEIDPGVTADGSGGIRPPKMLESQRRYLELFGRRELECFEEKRKHKFTYGILAYIHKVRQVSATAFCRGLTLHRMMFWPGTRALAGSLDSPRVSELFRRDKIIRDYLPFWMQPTVYPDVKDEEVGFSNPLNSFCIYQAENQAQGRGGLGVGGQWDVSHLTEVGLWQNPQYINFSFAPGLPKAITTLHVQESTANGKGYWQEVTEAARHKRAGYEHYLYIFIPWYTNILKNRMIPPPNWQPNEHTKRHAELIRKTSPEFFDGRTVEPTIEQLCWWEKTRAKHMLDGELASFLTNYPATPEQSFQNPEGSALPVELIEEMEQDVDMPLGSYEVELAGVAGE